MTNWQEIHSDFTSELQQKWENKGFDYEETKKWINIGLAPEEVELAYWLWDKKGKDVENFVEEQWVKTSLDRLREEFVNDIEESDDEFKSPSEGEINLWEHESNAQQWLSDNYPEEKRESIKELYINEKLEEKLDLSDFTNLEKIYVSYFVEEDGLEIKDKEKYEDKIIKLKNAQEYLEKYLEDNYPGKQKSEIESLNFDNKNLERTLDLSDFTNLTRLDCDNNKLTNLIVGNCSKIKTLYCQNSRLTDLDLTNLTELENLYCQGNQLSNIKYPLNSEKLVTLNISNNNFKKQDLNFFNQFTNLQSLYIGNDNKEEIEKGNYNRFYGSLETLKDLDKLTELDISNTNVSEGLEYLSENVGTLKCEVIFGELDFQVNKIREELASCDNDIKIWKDYTKEWKKSFENEGEIKQWVKIVSRLDKLDFVIYLKKEKNYTPNSFSKEKNKTKIWLDWKYPLDDEKKEITELDISNEGLEGSLELKGFINLEELNCGKNKLTSLNLNGLNKLKKLFCNDNLLTKIDYSTLNSNELTHLNVSNNNLSKKDLSEFSEFINLEELRIGNEKEENIREGRYNFFTGSLESLSELSKLKILNISNTDIENGLEILLESAKDIKEIYCSNKESKVNSIGELLKEKKVDFAFIDGKYTRLVDAQEWLDKEYPKEKRSEIKGLSISRKFLKGSLRLEGFADLETLDCVGNYLTDVNSLLSEINPKKLKTLYIYDNNFSQSDLNPFKKFVNLESLVISSNLFRKDYEQDVINRFTGSLEPLRNLTKLKLLYINNTDIDSGLECLPESLENLSCSGRYGVKRPEAKVKKIFEELEGHGEDGNYDLSAWKRNKRWQNWFANQKFKEFKNKLEDWIRVGDLKQNEVDFAAYLDKQGCSPSDIEDKKEELEKEYRQVKTWLNHNYPKEERKDIKILKIAKQNLEGELDLSDFTSLEKLDCSGNKLRGLTLTEKNQLESLSCNDNPIKNLNLSLKTEKLANLDVDFKELSEKSLEIVKEVSLRLNKELLSKLYPDKNIKRIISRSWRGFKGYLDLSEYKDLEELDCRNSQLISIDVSKNTKLKRLDCSDNKLIEILGIENCVRLKEENFNFKGNESLDNDSKSLFSKISDLNAKRGEWKNIKVQEWLDQEYPKNDKCCGVFDLENKDKFRKDIEELNISGNELTGKLKLEGFKGLRYLTCHNNKLEEIDLSDCPKLIGLDCRSNKLTKLMFNENCNLVELQASDNRFKNMKDIFGRIRVRVKDKYSAPTLSHFNINNNKISDGRLSDFTKFKNLIILSIGDTNNSEGSEKNKFTGSLKDLGNLKNLEEVDIRGNGIDKNEEFLEKWREEKILKNLNKIYYSFSEPQKGDRGKDEFSKESKEKNKHNYNEKDKFYYKDKGQRTAEIKSIIKLPILGIDKKEEGKKGIKDYSVDGRLIYPSEEAGFSWKTIGELPLSKLPTRLYEIDSQRVTDNDLLVEKKEELKKYLGGLDEIHLKEDFKKKIVKYRTSTELYEIKTLLKDIISLKKEEKEKYESYLETIREHQKKIHENSIRMRTFENLAENDERCIKRWKERNKGKEINSLYEIYDEYLEIEKLIKLTPQQETSKKVVRQEIRKIESYEDWQKRFEDFNLSTVFTKDIIDKWRKRDNFDIAGDVKNLLSMMKEKESEFINKLKEKCYVDNLKDLVTQKSPKEVITIIERFKYDQNPYELGRYEKDKSGILSEDQINDYLYKKAIGKIIEDKLTVSRTKKVGDIKRRIEFIDGKGENNAKHYAILSYTWDGDAKEDIKWSTKEAINRLSPGGKKSLDKALKTLKVLNEFHLFKRKKDNKHGSEIKYLWMDQLCINQNNPREKQHEVPRMREYYGNATVTLVAIHDSIGEETMKKLLDSFEKGRGGFIHPNEIVENSLPILKKIIDSNWFKRSWTYQEGFLSKQTVFMFDDFLIDGRFMALIWKLKQVSKVHYDECGGVKELCEEKIATPVGWVYYEWEEKGYELSDQASLCLNEGLWAVKNRGRSIALDGIYSIIGLLPYGLEVKVNYERDPESVLREVMLIAMENGHGEPLAWHGSGSKKLGLCWIPEVINNDISKGSSNVKGSIKIRYKGGKSIFEQDKGGIEVKGSEYIIEWKENGICKAEVGETVDGGLWQRRIWVKKEKNDNEKNGIDLTLSGTKEGIEAVDKGRVLIIPNEKTWESDIKFALLTSRARNYEKEEKIKGLVAEIYNLEKNDKLSPEKEKELQEKRKELDELDNVRHRIDLVRIEEGYGDLKKLKVEEKIFIVGLDNQEYQTQIEILPK